MGNFRYWRKMTWALVLWSAGIVVFMLVGGLGISSVAIAAVGLIVLGILWFMTRPLWRVRPRCELPPGARHRRPVQGAEDRDREGSREPRHLTRQSLGTRYCVFGPESDAFVASCSCIIARARLLERPRLTPMPTPLWKP